MSEPVRPINYKQSNISNDQSLSSSIISSEVNSNSQLVPSDSISIDINSHDISNSNETTTASPINNALTPFQRLLELKKIKGLSMTRPLLSSGPTRGHNKVLKAPARHFICQYCHRKYTTANRKRHEATCKAQNSSRNVMNRFLLGSSSSSQEQATDDSRENNPPININETIESSTGNNDIETNTNWIKTPQFSWLKTTLDKINHSYIGITLLTVCLLLALIHI